MSEEDLEQAAEPTEVEAKIEAQLEGVRLLMVLGQQRAALVEELAGIDDEISHAARVAVDAGLTWKTVFAAIRAKVKNPEDTLPLDSTVYTRARKLGPVQ